MHGPINVRFMGLDVRVDLIQLCCVLIAMHIHFQSENIFFVFYFV